MSKESAQWNKNDLFGRQYIDNPYPTYAYLRSNDPIHWNEGLNSWVVTRYGDVVDGLKDPRLTVKREKVKFKELDIEQRRQVRTLEDFFSNWFLYIDPPDHTRLRGVVNKAFSPLAVEQRRVAIENIVETQLDVVEGVSKPDILRDFSLPVSLHVVATLLGERPEDYKEITEWTDDIMGFFLGKNKGYDAMLRAQKSFDGFSSHLATVFSANTDHSLTSILGSLKAALKEGVLSKQEAESIYGNILLDGQEPISNGIANGIYALIMNPEQKKLLTTHPELVEPATEELLRYESPFQLSCRVASDDIFYRGKRIKKGQKIYLMLASANRDPDHFQNPDGLNIKRTDRQYAFGSATHFCLGASLARTTLQTAYLSVLDRFPQIETAQEKLEWQPYFSIRELKSLPVKI
ncbi:MAG: cytochrome P450 [Candidatus Levybacteria bacterium]|nr:cytochrome P450 [Candidatus Levybacteria bacterium]